MLIDVNLNILSSIFYVNLLFFFQGPLPGQLYFIQGLCGMSRLDGRTASEDDLHLFF